MFEFIKSSMASATQRFLTFELDPNRQLKTFNAAMIIHIVLAAVIFFLGETVGYWFLNSKLVIPLDRMHTAKIIYQFAIFSSMVTIMQTPYNAVIIARERMTFYAYMSIVEVALKLGAVMLLVFYAEGKLIFYAGDKLVFYGIMMSTITLCIFFVYRWFCKKKFEEARFFFLCDTNILKPMIVFSGWDIWGLRAGMFRDQGLNMLLNIFFGPAINAARSIAVQVQSAVMNFSNNFLTAVRPQIVKRYAEGNTQEMLNLAFISSKISFLFLSIFAIPLILENRFVLDVWLKNPPNYSVVFCQIVLLQSLLSSLILPIAFCVNATGKIKFMNIINSILYTSILPISYFLFKWGYSPTSGFVVNLILQCVGFFAWLWFLKRNVAYSITNFFFRVVVQCLFIVSISLILPLLFFFTQRVGVLRLFAVVSSFSCSMLILSYMIGLDREMKLKVNNILGEKIEKIFKKPSGIK